MNKLFWICTIALALTISGFAQKKPVKKAAASSGSNFEVTIEHNGQKTEIKWTQFVTADGTAVNADQGRVMLFFGGSNTKDEKNVAFNGWVPIGQTGTFSTGAGPGAGFSVMTSIFSNVPIFGPGKDGVIEITNNPTHGGFVTGTFRGTCDVMTSSGEVEKYTVSGSFTLKRM